MNKDKIFNCSVCGVKMLDDGTYDIASWIDIIYAETPVEAKAKAVSMFVSEYPDIDIDIIIIDKVDITVDVKISQSEVTTSTTIITNEVKF